MSGYFNVHESDDWLISNNDPARKEINPAMHASKRKMVVQIDKSGKELAVFASLIEAQQKTGIPAQGISRVALGHYHSAGGFKWKYL
jgi:hypothetical protein